MTELDHSSQLC